MTGGFGFSGIFVFCKQKRNVLRRKSEYGLPLQTVKECHSIYEGWPSQSDADPIKFLILDGFSSNEAWPAETGEVWKTRKKTDFFLYFLYFLYFSSSVYSLLSNKPSWIKIHSVLKIL